MSHFQDRWEPHFGTEPWWQSIVHQHDHVGDWDAPASQAVEALVYDLALARGLSVEHACPQCSRLHTGFSCYECAACVLEEAARDKENTARVEEVKQRHAAWRASLTPAQYEEYERQQQKLVRLYMGGILARDVQ